MANMSNLFWSYNSGPKSWQNCIEAALRYNKIICIFPLLFQIENVTLTGSRAIRPNSLELDNNLNMEMDCIFSHDDDNRNIIPSNRNNKKKKRRSQVKKFNGKYFFTWKYLILMLKKNNWTLYIVRSMFFFLLFLSASL